MRLPLTRSVIRSWQAGDVASLVETANNRNIWLNLRDRFPHPYTKRDAQGFIKLAREMNPETYFAIEIEGRAVGSIGFNLQHDVERVSGEIGYWLGEPFWGRGIVSEALGALTRYAIERHGLTRLFAVPFAHNVASCRVLEKAGYQKEARLRRSAIKNGEVIDQWQYSFIAPYDLSRPG